MWFWCIYYILLEVQPAPLLADVDNRWFLLLKTDLTFY